MTDTERCMGIIDITDEVLLIRLWIDTPGPTDDPDITLRYRIARHTERLETILYLTERIELVHLGSLYSWLVADIALGQSLIGRTIDALAWTSPELGEERYHRNSRERTNGSLAENLADTQFIHYFSGTQ